MNVLKTSLLALAASAVSIASQADEYHGPEVLQKISGTYRSAAPEPWYGGYGIREFIMRDGTWALIFTHAMDPGMLNRTFQYRTSGPYDILGPSPDVENAFQGKFTYAWKHVTLLTDNPELQAAYGLAGCDLTLNLEADISESGCGNWRPVVDCAADYDLFAATEDGIFFGERAADNDMCTPDKTPTALLPMVPRYGG